MFWKRDSSCKASAKAKVVCTVGSNRARLLVAPGARTTAQPPPCPLLDDSSHSPESDPRVKAPRRLLTAHSYPHLGGHLQRLCELCQDPGPTELFYSKLQEPGH
jgi:hypothetical protein